MTPPDENLTVLRDALARVTRIADFIGDGELVEAEISLEDLANDLWKAVRAA